MVAVGSTEARIMWRIQAEKHSVRARLWKSSANILHVLNEQWNANPTVWMYGSQIARRAGVERGHTNTYYLPNLVKLGFLSHREGTERTGHNGGGRMPQEYRISTKGRRLADLL